MKRFRSIFKVRMAGEDYQFPVSTVMTPGESLWLVPFDPATNASAKALFCAIYFLDAGTVRLLGPYSGNLSNEGERLSLEKPQASDNPENLDDISWIIVDELIWLDEAPWPGTVDGSGPALLRILSSGNNPASWTTTDDVDLDRISDQWELMYAQDLDVLDDGMDFDGDQASDYEEYRAGTKPTDSNSVFRATLAIDSATKELSWSSVSGKVYQVFLSTNLADRSFVPVRALHDATPPFNKVSMSNTAASVFYRITVDDGELAGD